MNSCPQYKQGFDLRIGIDYTFMETSIIFSLIGAGFGVAFATSNFDSIYWSETSIFKRILRALIGGGFTVGLFYLATLIPISDFITTYTFRYSVPNLISAFIVFGFVPLFCKLIGLVMKNPTETSDDASTPLLNDGFNIKVEKLDSKSSKHLGAGF